MELRGIDVSHWQGKIDWKRVAAAGVHFAMIKGFEGSKSGKVYTDSCFDRNMTEAHKAGIAVGVYLYSGAMTAQAAKLEAENAVARLETYRNILTWPVAYDIEKASQGETGRRSVNTAQAKAFCATVQAAGYTPMLYCNPAWATSYIDVRAVGADVWLAHYTYKPGLTSYKGEKTIHQYSDKGSVPGITGKVDLNVAYKQYDITREDDLGMIYKTVGDVPYGEMRETIRKLVQAECLRGGADGCINVPHEVARGYVVNRRTGAYEGIGIPRKWDESKKMFVNE